MEFEEYDTPETRTENGVAAMPAYPAPSRLTHSELVDLRGASHQGGVDSEPR